MSSKAHKVGQRNATRLVWRKTLTHSAGSLLFCPDCGTLLALPRDQETSVACDQCGREEPASGQYDVPDERDKAI